MQGSVLRPKLYTVYAIFQNIAAKQLQIHANILQKYFSKSKLTINATKAEVINFTKINKQHNLTNFKIQGK